MLSDSPVFPSIRVSSLQTSREFYEGKLRLKVIYDKPGELLLLAGKNSRIYLYEGEKSTATHTLAVFYVEDMEKTIDELTSRGVIFEHYSEGPLKTDDRGITTHDGKKSAWFRDPDGNFLGLSKVK